MTQFTEKPLHYRMDCYKHVIQNDSTLYYQLDDFFRFGVLYFQLTDIMIILEKADRQITKESRQFPGRCITFLRSYAEYIYDEHLDYKLAQKNMSAELYKKLIETAKEVKKSKAEATEPEEQ